MSKKVENPVEQTTAITITGPGKALVIRAAADLPMVLPPMEKKDLFNMLQDTVPIAELQGEVFQIFGIFPEWTQVPRNDAEEDEDGNYAPEDMREAQRLIVMANKDTPAGPQQVIAHSFSTTFNKALVKAINVFGNDWLNAKFKFIAKTRPGKNGPRQFYVVTAV